MRLGGSIMFHGESPKCNDMIRYDTVVEMRVRGGWVFGRPCLRKER